YLLPPGWLVYTLCTGALLCSLGATGMVIVFALFVQSQSLSLAQLDAGLREREADGSRELPPGAI
ncbi:MAG: hypothetical protein M3O46_04900, partial [Myxococcota bacterium]|nr:hypothetical protein [Myxococcota bacterium]